MFGLISAAALTFAAPWWLAGLVLTVAPAVIALAGRRRGRRIPAAAVAAQSLALAAAVLALARPRAALTGRANLPHLLLVDSSGSTRGQEALAERLNLPAWARPERFDFAEGIARHREPDGAGAPPSFAPDAATRIGPVLRMIAARGPEQIAAAIILTDGQFTDPGWEAHARALASGGTELLIVPQQSPPPDARIVSVAARRRSAGDKVDVRVTVLANAPMRRTITVWRQFQAEPIHVQAIGLLPNSPATVRLSEAVAPDSAAQYVARLTGSDPIPENDSAAAVVLPVRQRIAADGLGPEVRGMLDGLGLPVSNLAFMGHNESPEVLENFSAVVLADETGAGLSPAQRAALGKYVRNGGGLVMLGTGPHGSPADENDPLNRVLPLLANPYQRRPLHVFVLLDRSGSMARTTYGPDGAEQIKFELAAEAVVALKGHLTARDGLTVITFADRPEAAYDSGDARADFTAVRQALRGVRPAGSTKVIPAIRTALDRPARAATTRMLLILSDLQTEPFEPAGWAERIRRAGARMGVVAIGQTPTGATAAAEPPEDPPLSRLARLLGESASYQQREHLAGLAKLFGELVRQGRGQVVRRQPSAVVVASALFDTALQSLPDVSAYLLCGQQPEAELLARTADGEPILARRRVGLGRTVSLALPLSGQENRAWRRSPDVPKLLTSAVRWVLRGANDPRFDGHLTRRGSKLEIVVTARENGAALNRLRLRAALVAGPRAESGEMTQTAPGKYEASLPCPPDEAAAVALYDEAGAAVWRDSAEAMYPEEFRRIGPDWQALGRLAEITGGRIVAPDRLAQALHGVRGRRLTDLWPALIGLALAIMLGEWSLTRVARR